MLKRKIPLRKCMGCNEMKPKKELVRVVRSPEGEISLDLKGRKPGRGAYVCPDLACLAKARKGKRFERSFECRISDDIYELMEKELQGND
ncbi:MAG: YlxR family protein [Clostridiales bacterium]|nr:YlxR family protein [Clostridiales bacterium]